MYKTLTRIIAKIISKHLKSIANYQQSKKNVTLEENFQGSVNDNKGNI